MSRAVGGQIILRCNTIHKSPGTYLPSVQLMLFAIFARKYPGRIKHMRLTELFIAFSVKKIIAVKICRAHNQDEMQRTRQHDVSNREILVYSAQLMNPRSIAQRGNGCLIEVRLTNLTYLVGTPKVPALHSHGICPQLAPISSQSLTYYDLIYGTLCFKKTQPPGAVGGLNLLTLVISLLTYCGTKWAFSPLLSSYYCAESSLTPHSKADLARQGLGTKNPPFIELSLNRNE